jgi:hypothetical protein
MKTNRLWTGLISILKPVLPTIAAAAVLAAGAGAGRAQCYSGDWKYDFAYTLGVQAYIYGFPWINMASYRWQWVTQPPPPGSDQPYAPLNKFSHATTLKDASYLGGGNPNTDTLYSMAWLDLTTEPVILSVPAIDRYYTMEIAGFDSDNFAYVGTRSTGTNAGNYLIAGPNWEGGCPANVTPLTASSRTPYVLIIGRTLVYDADDLPNVHAIQAQYNLTPLSYWGTPDVPPDNRNVWAPDNSTDGLAVWRTMNRAMTENPPNVPSQQGLVDYFAQIGVGPTNDVDKMDDLTKAALRLAATNGWIMLNQFLTNPPSSYFVTNGWVYSPPDNGRAGQSNDFMMRAAGQSLLGILNNDPQEAIYLASAGRDASGHLLSGANTYTMTFASNGLPDVGAFWSATMYGADNNLVSNSISRYKVGTYPTNLLALNADGTMTIYIQNAPPSADKLSNWLPAPAGGFHLIMRLYQPGPAIVNQTWGPPPILQVSSPSAGVNVQLRLVNGQPQLTWRAAAGLSFQVQHLPQLWPNPPLHWTTLPEAVTSADGNYSFMDDAQVSCRFYRVLQLP